MVVGTCRYEILLLCDLSYSIVIDGRTANAISRRVLCVLFLEADGESARLETRPFEVAMLDRCN